ncbi:MAG: 4-hydroxy-tetrahydrodipicolinate synthase [Oscillospiraceae bacterium]|jgi:4-hydroxy-tetrahydrodipicolinate synthase|nr:4-hydroxy-tetrahydrodipicolinate synthase [Oscillospiraceae bacterium]
MENTIFTGSGVAIITPMNPDLSINYELFGALIEEQITKGTSALIVCGTTGEASTMTDEEHNECIRFAVEKTAKRIPVIAGTGSNDTAYMVELSVEAEKLGADALLIMTPYYNKTSQRGLVKHFGAVAEKVGIPIMLYNIPSRTNMNIELNTFKELAEYPNIRAVKESGQRVDGFSALINESGLDVYSGDDFMTVPVMSLGAKGVVSVLANVVPEVVGKICALCLENNFREAGRLQQKYARFMGSGGLFIDVNPIPVKAAMNLMGKNVGGCRLPLCDMESAKLEKLQIEMINVGIL